MKLLTKFKIAIIVLVIISIKYYIDISWKLSITYVLICSIIFLFISSFFRKDIKGYWLKPYEIELKKEQEQSRHIPESIKQEVLKRQNNTCAMCSETKFLEFHHKIKFSENGLTTTDNLVALCPNHHKLAHAQNVEVNYKKTI